MNMQEAQTSEEERKRNNQAQQLPSYSQMQSIPLYNQQGIAVQPGVTNLSQPQVLTVFNNQPQGYSYVMYRTNTYLIWSVINTLISGIFFYR
jgi:hypothetical protein